ncbi:hypothetical protein CMN24_04565 [Candidatus Saccharibacteria bacterium]|nr:hypothetical protein [Candidatus Saccharibacteria bacterium]
MERCVKSIKEELGPLAQFQTINELYIGMTNAIAYYNTQRIHTALKMPPRDYVKNLRNPRKLPRMVFGKRGV